MEDGELTVTAKSKNKTLTISPPDDVHERMEKLMKRGLISSKKELAQLALKVGLDKYEEMLDNVERHFKKVRDGGPENEATSEEKG